MFCTGLFITFDTKASEKIKLLAYMDWKTLLDLHLGSTWVIGI